MMTESSTDLDKEWRGEFGDEYVGRNQPTEQRIQQRVRAFCAIFDRMTGASPASILECGSNVGLNLRAIQTELGHENPQTTALYTQLTDPVQQDTARLINTMVSRLSIAGVGRTA